jgi:hypothetical protein
MIRTGLVTLAMLALGTGAASAGDHESQPPKPRGVSGLYDTFDNSFVRPATRAFDPALGIRRLAHDRREAANVDADDQVRLPSTWWQPRIGWKPVSVDRMLHGPGDGQGPAPGPWKVTQAKSQGVTPGFQIVDSKGDKYVIKFDVPQFPCAATAADVIGSYLFWGAGYNVPDNSIAYFRLADLVIAPDAKVTVTRGRKQPMTREYLVGLLARTMPPDSAGRYRCMASRYLSGKPIGPFRYSGRRNDDPEDLVPHELRRELRGLWTIAAWVNHADSRSMNSLDMWVTDHGRSFVRHHLIDFGSTLGSTATRMEREYSNGFEYYVDYGVAAKQTATLGTIRPKWFAVRDPQIPEVGFIESTVFDPAAWRPDYPNPAFDERTERDVRWGAKIVAGFTDEHIRAAVAKGELPPRAAEYLTQVLIERRDKIVRRWLPDGTGPAERASE